MQITETMAEGLKRQYKVVLQAGDLAKRMDDELVSLQKRANIPGFRPGKVPQQHLRRVYGKSVMADVVQNAVNEINRKIVDDNGLKLAFEPAINFPQDQSRMEEVMEAKGDLEYTVALEVLPKIEIVTHADIALERQVAEVPEADVVAAIERMAEPSRPYTDKGAAKAASGDRVTVDFVGRIDGVEFEGGKGEGIQVVLGSNSFIPGFEDQLIGMKAGDTKLVKVTFPTNYQAPGMAGKDAEFDVKATLVEVPGELSLSDDLARQYGMEDLAKLKDAVRISMSSELEGVARRKMKRKLLDALDAKYAFDLPPTLLDQEFSAIWNNVTTEMKAASKTFEDEGTTEAEARDEYLKIATRRVRLGLVLAEIGEKAAVQVTDDEVSQGLVARARQFPGQEKAVWEYYRKNPQALAEIRAPIFEEKVVDHLLGQVAIVDKPVSKEALLAEDDEDEAPAKPAKAKKAAAASGGEEAKPAKAPAKKAKKAE
ncbi:MAG: trigger factor [Methylocystis sp.]|nr:trigger factor [Methylocystis sp.]MCA3584024.1 trigger factor [Methylocystis sp.]MCA3591638.1 trigger factor [Methylocystis sp.]